ncbi:MAG: hypothetical protein ABSC17_03585 [Thermacetogeniaceae bacterium]
MGKFNDWLADCLADGLSSMACFWIITSMVIVVLFWQRPNSMVGWITYISTAIFQASALPVLGFVSNKESAKLQALMQETHDTTMNELKLIGEDHDELRELVRQVHIKVKAGEVDVTVTEEETPSS